MTIREYSDQWLLAKLENAYLLTLEAGDAFIPHNPSEWEGRGRQSVYADMVELVEELESECVRRHLDYTPVEHHAELQWELKHEEWR